MLKSAKQLGKSMLISSFTLCLNLFLNAVFIFGLGGEPKLGTIRVAIATLIARMTELAICLADYWKRKIIRLRWSKEHALWRSFVKVSTPMALQGFAWA